MKLISDYQAAMAGLNGQRITNHETLDTGVTATTYEGGAKVYVNYGMEDYQAGPVLIPARGYVVEGGEQE